MRSRRPSRVAIVSALAWAIFAAPEEGEARSSGRHRRFDSAPVEVTSPLASETLRAGETVVLAWQPLPELARHSGFEEWEAFLSLDDGERYPIRLTPHLDLRRRSFSVTLPQFAARRARLLLRFGDEREEFEYEVPGEFVILAGPERNSEPAGWARGRGERARPEDPNDPGVAIWVEGSRRGQATRTVAAAESGIEIGAIEPQGWIAFRHATAAPEPLQVAAAEQSTHPLTGLSASTFPAPGAPPRADPIEPRRSTCRQNE